jgi:hypothetical protein
MNIYRSAHLFFARYGGDAPLNVFASGPVAASRAWLFRFDNPAVYRPLNRRRNSPYKE